MCWAAQTGPQGAGGAAGIAGFRAARLAGAGTDGRLQGSGKGGGQGIEAGCGCNDYTYEEVEGMVTVFGIGIR